jgi:disulfide bond formation protein DsbB
MTALQKDTAAGLLVGSLSALLLAGAFLFQYAGGLAPCEMCIWQRWPHGAAILLGLGSAMLAVQGMVPEKAARSLAWLAIAALIVTGAIGVFHAGVEWKFWPGPPHCTGTGYDPRRDGDVIQIVRCDEAQWRLLGISLAGYNAILSLAVAAIAVRLLRKQERA